MSKRKNKELVKELFDDCASAHECTGLRQPLPLDPEEVALFHRLFNEEE